MIFDALGRLFASIGRFMSFGLMFRSKEIDDAADAKFADTIKGIEFAGSLEKERLTKVYDGYKGATARLNTRIRKDKAMLEGYEKELVEKRSMSEGALQKIEEARTAGNKANEAKYSEKWTEYSKRITQLEGLLQGTKNRLAQANRELDTHIAQLGKLEARRNDVDPKTADAVRVLVTKQEWQDLRSELAGLKRDVESGPWMAVLKATEQRQSELDLDIRIAGADEDAVDEELRTLGEGVSTSDALEQVLAARAAEKAEKTGVPAEPPKETAAEGGSGSGSDRPRF